jgi:ABC-type phosphate/phosphonate transport system substrate-binding protein
LCNLAADDLPTVAWIDGLAAPAALERACGAASLIVLRGDAAGLPGQIVIDRQLGTRSLSAVNGRTYCRLGYADTYSWLLPGIAFISAGVDLARAAEIVEQPDAQTLAEAVASGECALGGLPAGTLAAYGLVDSIDLNIALTTPPLPYPTLLVAPEVELGVRLSLEDALLTLAESPDGAALLRPLLTQDGLRAASADDFAELRDFLAANATDLARLGE